jgi:hypothetical protein
MMTEQQCPSFESPAMYQIRVQGCLDKGFFDQISGAEIDIRMESLADGSPMTAFTCQFINQSALSRALNLLFERGFPLLSVRCLTEIR